MNVDNEIEKLQRQRPNILIVDDDENYLALLKSWFSKICHVFLARNRKQALEMIGKRRIDIALIDINLRPGDGVKLANDMDNMCMGILIHLMTGDPNHNFGRLKTNIQCLVKASSEKLMVPQIMHLWHLQNGLRDDLRKKLELIHGRLPYKDLIEVKERGSDKDFEYFDGILRRNGGMKQLESWLRWVIYRYPEHPGLIDLGVTVAAGGCAARCQPCLVGKQKGPIVKLTRYEMVALGLILLDSFVSYGFLESNPRFSMNYTCGNDWIYNPEEVIGSMEQWSEVKDLLNILFIVTSIGNYKIFERYLPRLAAFMARLYISMHSLDAKKRDWFSAAMRGQSPEKLRDLLGRYHDMTGLVSTICWALALDFNDSDKDADDIAGFCEGWPLDVKVMPIADGSMPGHPKIVTAEHVHAFVEKLAKRGVNARARFAVGPEHATCGRTIPVNEISRQSHK